MASGAPPSSAEPTCEDCFFRRELLCALPGNTVCPTFRAASQPSVLKTVPAPGPRRIAVAVAAA